MERDEAFQRAVVGSLHIVRKKASGKLPHLPVVLDTLAAESLAAARFISAIAPLEVSLEIFALFLFHNRLLAHKRVFPKSERRKEATHHL